MVVNVLKCIIASGSMVIMSIHQPSFEIIGLLNCLLFFSRGQTVYSSAQFRTLDSTEREQN
uniref:Uncharacterized protein n=1 Tax=Nelumbo nucifera TaxID=4432 RepID=A0A822Y2A1_NELNU|nr:TPA_asm: hypothetical protein HUJ06_026893 [Nelumbo nucifera]